MIKFFKAIYEYYKLKKQTKQRLKKMKELDPFIYD